MTKSITRKNEEVLVDVKITHIPLIDEQTMNELKTLTTMSSQIRFLDSKGVSRGSISKILSELHKKLVRYQWVRNVLITPIKKQK